MTAVNLHRQHGTRAKYVVEKCRCEPCKDANRRYNRDRQRNERRAAAGIEQLVVAYVDTAEARDHLRWLSSIGIGKRTVHKVTGVALSSIEAIRAGQMRKARARTVDRILAVGKHRTHGRIPVDPQPAFDMIDQLRANGWTNARIAQALGLKTPALQYRPDRPMLLDTVVRISRLHRSVFGSRLA
jgi:hypothetical protein